MGQTRTPREKLKLRNTCLQPKPREGAAQFESGSDSTEHYAESALDWITNAPAKSWEGVTPQRAPRPREVRSRPRQEEQEQEQPRQELPLPGRAPRGPPPEPPAPERESRSPLLSSCKTAVQSSPSCLFTFTRMERERQSLVEHGIFNRRDRLLAQEKEAGQKLKSKDFLGETPSSPDRNPARMRNTANPLVENYAAGARSPGSQCPLPVEPLRQSRSHFVSESFNALSPARKSMTAALDGPSSINVVKLPASMPNAWQVFPLSHSSLGSMSPIFVAIGRRRPHAQRQVSQCVNRGLRPWVCGCSLAVSAFFGLSPKRVV